MAAPPTRHWQLLAQSGQAHSARRDGLLLLQLEDRSATIGTPLLTLFRRWSRPAAPPIGGPGIPRSESCCRHCLILRPAVTAMARYLQG
jgi:hypothetical protein